MWRRRPSQSDPTLPASNPAYAYPYSSHASNSFNMTRRGPLDAPPGHRLTRRVTWRSFTYKIVAYLYLLGILYIVWLLRDIFTMPFSSSPPPFSARSSGKPSLEDHLAQFIGREECGISSRALYQDPPLKATDKDWTSAYCPDRVSLLNSLSDGGRSGLHSPFRPRGCNYRWYSTAEICNILQRFDRVLFVGDSALSNIYGAVNILLRENLSYGALEQWIMSNELLESCKCEKQFVNPQCTRSFVHSSDDIYGHDSQSTFSSPYSCDHKISHTFIDISGASMIPSSYRTLNQILHNPRDSRKAVAVIHSLGLSISYTQKTAAMSMSALAEMTNSMPNSVSLLWVGPPAAGYLKSPNAVDSQDNNVIWRYTLDTMDLAKRNGIDALALYNATIQADNSDGSQESEEGSLTQAMMIMNWLASLD